MRIFVGNLSYETTDADLTALFEQCGRVESAQVVLDRETGRPRGFGFVEMRNPDSATAAVEELNGAELCGRNISVTEARPKGAAGGPRPRGAQRPPSGRPRPERENNSGSGNSGGRERRGRDDSGPSMFEEDDYARERRSRRRSRKDPRDRSDR